MTNFEKYRIALRYYLQGREAYAAMRAMTFAEKYHCGLRKDGVTPEFQHQVEIAHYLCTISGALQDFETTIIVALLHDTMEDYNVPYGVVASQWGEQVAQYTQLLNKSGQTTEHYYSNLCSNPITSIVKGADRMHNLKTMVGVFTPEKQQKYVVETEEHVIPMLKRARRAFPEQSMAYENIKHTLNLEMDLIRAMHRP